MVATTWPTQFKLARIYASLAQALAAWRAGLRAVTRAVSLAVSWAIGYIGRRTAAEMVAGFAEWEEWAETAGGERQKLRLNSWRFVLVFHRLIGLQGPKRVSEHPKVQ